MTDGLRHFFWHSINIRTLNLRGFFMDKKIVLAAAALFAVASCSSGSKPEEKKGPTAKEVMDKYVDTVTTARPMAEAAKKAADERTEEQKKMIEETDK